MKRIAAVLALACFLGQPVKAEEVRVAVAANFAPTLRQLQPLFERQSGHRLTVSSGSTGKLYAQILHGGPYDVFLAADAERPARLEDAGLAIAGSRLTYAVGRLVLWSRRPGVVAAGGEILRRDDLRHLAIANPRTAPYGVAALEVLERLGLRERLADRLVVGESVGQSFHFVASGNAEVGFVAASQVRGRAGSGWLVPPDLHSPIEQQGVALTAGAPARELLAFLGGAEARAAIRAAGYDEPGE